MTIKIGLIGCGGIAETHASGYLKLLAEAQVTAVSDVIATSAEKLAEHVNGARVFSDYHDLLTEGDVDAVDICLPHHLHKDAIVAAAAAGKHILCEKPLCLNLAEAEEIGHVISTSGITLMCAHNQLFMPAVHRAKQLLLEGVLGQVYELRTVDAFRHTWNMESGIGWRSRRETMGGGELIDTGYHPSYLLLHFAASEPIEVAAMISSHRLHTLDGEDSAQVLVRFADGSVGNIVTSWAYDLPANTGSFQIVGERGQIYSLGHNLHYRLLGEEPVTITLPSVNTYHEEIVDFVACLREKRKPINTEVDGIKVLKVILGAYQSAAEKRIISLV
jgi:predicted dehydrogenase